MTFARVVFRVAGVWGIVVLTPLYFLVDLTGRQYAAPVDYPHFFYGFLSVAMAWQFAFLVIGSSPSRRRGRRRGSNRDGASERPARSRHP